MFYGGRKSRIKQRSSECLIVQCAYVIHGLKKKLGTRASVNALIHFRCTPGGIGNSLVRLQPLWPFSRR